MLKERVLTAVIGLPLFLLLLYFGGIPLAVVILATSLLGLFEYLRCLGTEKGPLFPILAILTVLTFVLAYFCGEESLVFGIVLCFLSLACCMVLRFGKTDLVNVTGAFLGFVYIPVILLLFLMLREKSIWYVPMVLIAAWGSDTCAYFAGKAMGKHKMAPVLSPKKTWEGFFGGILGAALLALLYAFLLRDRFSLPAPVLSVTVITALASVFGVAGDLFASAIKRTYGKKDYGNVFPGHGGMMDRIDSMIFCTPVIYFAVKLLEKLW